MEMDKCSDTAGSRAIDGQQTKLMAYINNNIIGKNKKFASPFGPRAGLYCDYTASGRSLFFLENFMHDHVLPDYGNIHTTTTVTSLQTTLFRHEARDIIRNSVNAGENDAVIFTGSGCTGAVQKLLHALDLSSPPVVFVSGFEHHSNLLPWRELSYKTIAIQETEKGELNLMHLEHELQVWQFSGRPLIGSFIAASNVTGYLLDTVAIAELLHRYGALALFDYATAGPYIKIDMNPIIPGHDPKLTLKDAIFLSPHKFIGGVQTPGVLVAKRHLFRCSTPQEAGGGTVFFVSRDHHRYHEELELREEGGTPAIVESIRAGLVFQLKDCVGVSVIEDRENELVRRALKVFSTTPDLVLLGSTVPKHLPIFSFLIRHCPTGLYLHHNFVCTLLNDLFGVQVRGGCMCAGPLGMELLGISEGLARKYENVLEEDSRLDRVHLRRHAELSDLEILKPGFSRLSLAYFMSDEEVEFVLEAVKMVAEYGWTLLPQYKFSPHSGEWTHHKHTQFTDRRWLGQVNYSHGHMTYEPDRKSCDEPLESAVDWQTVLSKARAVFEEAAGVHLQLGDQTLLFDEYTAELRWFLLPSEAYQSLKGEYVTPQKLPWKPTTYPRPEVKPEGWTRCQCSSAQSKRCVVHKDIGQATHWMSPWAGQYVIPKGKVFTKLSHEDIAAAAPALPTLPVLPSIKHRESFSEAFVRVCSSNLVGEGSEVQLFQLKTKKSESTPVLSAADSDNDSDHDSEVDEKVMSVWTADSSADDSDKDYEVSETVIRNSPMTGRMTGQKEQVCIVPLYKSTETTDKLVNRRKDKHQHIEKACTAQCLPHTGESSCSQATSSTSPVSSPQARTTHGDIDQVNNQSSNNANAHHMKQLLAPQQVLNPMLFSNLQTDLQPLHDV